LHSAQARRDPKHQEHQHRDGKDHGDRCEAQHDAHPAETRVLEPDGFLLVPQGLEVALGMVSLEIADLLSNGRCVRRSESCP
jgi:hypothetical protein